MLWRAPSTRILWPSPHSNSRWAQWRHRCTIPVSASSGTFRGHLQSPAPCDTRSSSELPGNDLGLPKHAHGAQDRARLSSPVSARTSYPNPLRTSVLNAARAEADRHDEQGPRIVKRFFYDTKGQRRCLATGLLYCFRHQVRCTASSAVATAVRADGAQGLQHFQSGSARSSCGCALGSAHVGGAPRIGL